MALPNYQDRLLILQSMSVKMQYLQFASLPRPKADAKSPPTRDLINWTIEVYAFSLLSHFREMLRSFLFLVENCHVAASFVICRTMFEMAAHVYYVNKHVQQYLKSNDLEQSWKFLIEIQHGSRHMQEYSGEPDYESPPHISKAINCFNEYLKGTWSTERYSFLSEYTHPGPFAFGQHLAIDDAFNSILFVPPSRDASNVLLSPAIVSTSTVLSSIYSLLPCAGDGEIAQQIKRCIEELVRLHKKDKP